MAKSFDTKNPCLSCGACCAHFRVAFYWRESEKDFNDNPVPNQMTTELDQRYRCMKGTDDKHHPKCVALKGKVGVDACCSIYTNRPTPCRQFEASFETGKRNPRCDEARKAHGLKVLTKDDWRTSILPSEIEL